MYVGIFIKIIFFYMKMTCAGVNICRLQNLMLYFVGNTFTHTHTHRYKVVKCFFLCYCFNRFLSQRFPTYYMPYAILTMKKNCFNVCRVWRIRLYSYRYGFKIKKK